jgi:hypothetical protein
MNDYQLLSRRGRSEYVTQRSRSGERVTVPQRRTGWLDRELDYETAPGHVRHKLYDLDHRKYDGATALFLSVDRNSAYLTINDPARLVLLVITRNSTRNTTQQVITVVR